MGEPESGHWNFGGPKIYNEADIDSAIAAGALSAEAAARLKRHVVRNVPLVAADEESFRLVGGFNDIFVVIACLLLLSSLGFLLRPLHDSLGAAGVAVTAWGLAEYFVRRKRLALTAIVLLACFAAGVFLGVLWLDPSIGIGIDMIAVSAAATATATWLHWRRFYVPVAVACGAAAALALLFATLAFVFPALEDFLPPVFFCFGLIVLTLAIRWDSSDIARRTRRSDVAFWLHLLAAPLLVHPLFSHLGVFSGATSASMAWIMITLYGIIGLVSLILDRRALMVSSLAYVIYAFTVVFKEYGAIREEPAGAALVIGVSLVLLAALWRQARARVVRLLPHGVQAYLPPVRD